MARVFSPNTNNFLAFFIVFEWGRFLERAVDKWEVKCNAKLHHNLFAVNISVLAVVFCQHFSKKQQFKAKLLFSFNLFAKHNSWYGNVHRKIIRN